MLLTERRKSNFWSRKFDDSCLDIMSLGKKYFMWYFMKCFYSQKLGYRGLWITSTITLIYHKFITIRTYEHFSFKKEKKLPHVWRKNLTFSRQNFCISLRAFTAMAQKFIDVEKNAFSYE